MALHNEIGQWGEKVAREHLVAQGYALMESNMHLGHKEIDIIALKGSRIVFVEVKTRSTAFADPTDAIDTRKIKRLARAADAFMQAFNIRHSPQFDVITIVGSPHSFELHHYPDAFLPPLAGAW